MKQHISPKQLAEVSFMEANQIYGTLVERHDFAEYHHKKFTIGKMMEILEGHDSFDGLEYFYIGEPNNTTVCYLKVLDNKYKAPELVDCLWLAVKDIHLLKKK